MPGKCKFRHEWFTEPHFKEWLGQASKNTEAKCNVCMSIIDIPVWKVSFLHTGRHFIDLKVYAVFRISKNVMLDSILDKLVTRSCEVLLNFR